MPSYHRPFRKYTEEEKREYIKRQAGKIVEPAKKPTNKICAEIGRLIFELRKTSRISQRELGMKLGTYQSAIARLESGRHNIQVENLEKIAKVFGKKIKISIY